MSEKEIKKGSRVFFVNEYFKVAESAGEHVVLRNELGRTVRTKKNLCIYAKNQAEK